MLTRSEYLELRREIEGQISYKDCFNGCTLNLADEITNKLTAYENKYMRGEDNRLTGWSVFNTKGDRPTIDIKI